MTTQITLTTRDEELLNALALKVRGFSLRQIAIRWWHGELANTRRRLRQLVHVDLIYYQLRCWLVRFCIWVDRLSTGSPAMRRQTVGRLPMFFNRASVAFRFGPRESSPPLRPIRN